MASITGTANTPSALYDTLIAFLTDAIALGPEVWGTAWQADPMGPNPSDIILSGPGLAGTENVLVGMRLNEDVLNDRYSVSFSGASGVINSATAFNQHVNSLPDAKRLFLINQPMEYWFSANGRRFTVVVKVSTSYQSAYAGLILPYSLPTNYSYPLFIGAMAGTAGTLSPTNWTDISEGHRFYPNSAHSASNSQFNSSAALLDPMGQWLTVTGSRAGADIGAVGSLPYEGFAGLNINRNQETGVTATVNMPYLSFASRISRDFDDNYSLLPISLVQADPSDQVYGILDGVLQVSGNGQTAESIVSVASEDYLVVPNAFRSGQLDFLAMRLA